MNNKSNIFYLVIIFLVFVAGTMNGLLWSDYEIPIKWEPEIKAGDLIGFLVALITFIFAYKGFEENRNQFQISNQPILDLYYSCSYKENTISIDIENIGNGLANNIQCILTLNNTVLTANELCAKLLFDTCPKPSISFTECEHITAQKKEMLFQFRSTESNKSEEHFKNARKTLFEDLIYTFEYYDIFGKKYCKSFQNGKTISVK